MHYTPSHTNACKFLNFQLTFCIQKNSIFSSSPPEAICIMPLYFNPVTAKEFPLYEENRLALDRIKSISTSVAVKGLREIVFFNPFSAKGFPFDE